MEPVCGHCGIQDAFRRLEATSVMSLGALAAALDARDPYSQGHSRRVADLALLLTRRLGLHAAERRAIQRAALLHDLGKIGISDEILRKPGPLTKTEMAAMHQHPQIAYGILGQADFLNEALPSILHHHERWDGTGYPHRLSGSAIPLGARIIAIADAFDTMITDRPYRAGRNMTEALEEIRRGGGTQFDPSLAEVFPQLFARHREQRVRRLRLTHSRRHIAAASKRIYTKPLGRGV